jgi:hypothetical protein
MTELEATINALVDEAIEDCEFPPDQTEILRWVLYDYSWLLLVSGLRRSNTTVNRSISMADHWSLTMTTQLADGVLLGLSLIREINGYRIVTQYETAPPFAEANVVPGESYVVRTLNGFHEHCDRPTMRSTLLRLLGRAIRVSK